MSIKVVFFDVGETLVDESRLWKGWAAYFGVSTTEFLGVLHETIERGHDHRRALEHFKPGLDLAAARQERERFGHADLFDERDLYPDAQPSIRSLRSAGYRVGIAGNQPMQAEEVLARIGLQVDLVASSARWGVAKPNRAFFKKIIELAGVPAPAIAYVGDRLDNDILPARDAGLAAIFIARGSWGRAHARRPEIVAASRVIATMEVLPSVLAEL